jgi:hypothetical protein
MQLRNGALAVEDSTTTNSRVHGGVKDHYPISLIPVTRRDVYRVSTRTAFRLAFQRVLTTGEHPHVPPPQHFLETNATPPPSSERDRVCEGMLRWDLLTWRTLGRRARSSRLQMTRHPGSAVCVDEETWVRLHPRNRKGIGGVLSEPVLLVGIVRRVSWMICYQRGFS